MAIIASMFFFQGHQILQFCQSRWRLRDMRKVSFGFDTLPVFDTLRMRTGSNSCSTLGSKSSAAERERQESEGQLEGAANCKQLLVVKVETIKCK